MLTLKFTVFGGCEIHLPGNATLPISTRKNKALLVYLAMSAGQPQLRGKLTALLWDRSAEEQARASLRQTLWSLRKTMAAADADILRANADLVWLETDSFEVDAVRFQQLLEQNTIESLQQAVGLYRGDFLAGFSLREESFEEWLMSEREHLRERAMQALRRLLEHYEAQDELEAGLNISRQLLALDPLQESAYRAMMRLYWHNGQRSSALRQYETCARQLRDELGITPDPQTRELYQRILNNQPEQRLSTGPERLSNIDTGVQTIHYCYTPDKTRIAYTSIGTGPALVKAANWLSHLEFDWQMPVSRSWLDTLSAHYALTRYDERGCGLSDWSIDDFSFDAWVHDLEAVVDAAGLDRFPLLGISQGGPVAIAYAVKHPEKVSHLILYGAYARGKFVRDPSPRARAEEEALIQLVELGWGQENPALRQLFTAMFMPGGSAQQQHWFNELQKVSTSAANAARFLREFASIDVQQLAQQVQAPTLIMHAREDSRIPFAEGQLLASLVPNARFVALESNNHMLLDSEPAWPVFFQALKAFIDTPTPMLGAVAGDDPASSFAVDSNPPAPSLDKTETILIVDDDPQIRELLAEYLSNNGYQILEADSGQTMRQQLATQTPALVLLDVRLPGEDGLDLTRYLRQHYDLGIIMVTGAGEVVDRIVGLEMGADDYVAKPFDLRELLARIKSVLRRARNPR